jgi:hypothetical protein
MPVVDQDDAIYVASTSGTAFALRDVGTSGSVSWSKPLPVPLAVSPAISAAGELFVGDDAGNLHDFAAVLTRQDVEAACPASPVGNACSCACDQCAGQLHAVLTDPAALRIVSCASDEECSGIECFFHSGCRFTIERSGGPVGLSAALALSLDQCVTQACGADLRVPPGRQEPREHRTKFLRVRILAARFSDCRAFRERSDMTRHAEARWGVLWLSGRFYPGSPLATIRNPGGADPDRRRRRGQPPAHAGHARA